MSTVTTARLDLVPLDATTIDDLLTGGTSRIGAAPVPPGWVADSERVLRRRLAQIEADPTEVRWLLRAMVLRVSGEVVGRIGFHGRPGVNALGAADAVELGYTVEAGSRRRGYAREAITALIAWAADAGVDRVLVSVSPANEPSLALARQLGFMEITTVIDDEDGPEIVFGRSTRSAVQG